jgi:predicted methyltransferase
VVRVAVPSLVLLMACAAPAADAAAVAPEPAGVTEPAAPAGINDVWRTGSPRQLARRLESESREVWVHRERIVEVIGARPGMVVADVGAGSGFLTLLLARAVGPEGKVYAVDIHRGMLDALAARARKAGLTNVETLQTPEDSTPLAPNSVDLVLLCDAYHHFERPRSTMRSIRAALRPGGELVLIELERIPGKTSPAMLEHVRAGKEVFLAELLADGFELVREEDVPELEKNYVLRLRVRDGSGGRAVALTKGSSGDAPRAGRAPPAEAGVSSAAMSFGGSYRRIMAQTSPSHAWIELHRLVEAFCRTAGRPFTEVFAELEARFGFVRGEPRRWPDLETMRAAAEWLRAARAGRLAARRAWSAEQRRAKAAGRRGRAPAALREVEARSRAYAATVPRVGCWGWRRRRQGGAAS